MTLHQPRQLTRDGTAWLSADGSALYVLGAYTTPEKRDGFLEAAGVMARGLAAHLDVGPLCRTQHVQQVEPYDLPPFARSTARRMLRQLKAQHGKGFQLTRVWQHVGACPEDGPRA